MSSDSNLDPPFGSSGTQPRSVRNLYTPPQEEWVFIPPSSGGQKSNTTTSSSSSATASNSSPSVLPGRSASIAGIELDSSDLGQNDGFGDDGLGDGFSAYSMLQLLASEYFTTALGMPFEVGKTLLQVEWKPKEGVAPVEVFEDDDEDDDEEEEDLEEIEGEGDSYASGRRPRRRNTSHPLDEINNPEDADAYFSDVISGGIGSRTFIPGLGTDEGEGTEDDLMQQVDQDGYLPEIPQSYRIRTDVSPSGSSGVWGMMRRVRRTPSEGLPGLWKGQLLTTVHSILTNNLQPIVHEVLIFALPTSVADFDINTDLDFPLVAHPYPTLPLGLHVGAHLITHLFLSPLELLRTRMIVQPSTSPASLSSPSMLKQIVAKEGGVKGLFFSPQLLIPAVLEHTLRPLFTLSIPLFIERKLQITPDASPITYSMLDLGLGLASLLIILPIETARKRLQLQVRSSSGSATIKPSIIRLRDRPYVGVVDAIWRIVTEESGVHRKKKRRRTTRRLSATRRQSSVAQGEAMENQSNLLDGIKQLYRGFGMAAGAHLTVFALGLVSAGLGGRTVEMGWKEI